MDFTFQGAGTKYVNLVVKDARGLTARVEHDVVVGSGPPPPPSDTTPPTVSLTAPADGATVNGTTTLSADASDDVGVDHVSFHVDGNPTPVNTDSAAPYSYDWGSTAVRNGSHSITALAVDTSGNRTATLGATVTVNNVVSPPGTVTLQQVDGGPGYYGRFANALPTDPSFFPVGVWGEYDQSQAGKMNLDAAAGINTYVWAADSNAMSVIRADGRFHVIQDAGAQANVGSETSGWLLSDEDDMRDGSTASTCPGTLSSERGGLRADGRMRTANFGKGLALAPKGNEFTFNWWADAAEQNCWTNGVDLDSTDLYWFTDPYTSSANSHFGYLYGDNIRNLRHADASDGVMHPHWGFVETAWPFNLTAADGARSILPAEMNSAVWHQMIAGARGLIWFQHAFGGPCQNDSHTIQSNCAGTRPMATAVDAQLKALAPVLNASSVTGSWSKTGDVEASVKWANGHFYVIAGSRKGATSMTFSMPCVGDGTAVQVSDGSATTSRSVSVSGGSFTDSFADKNSVHIYRIDGGSSCGL
jgi:hypothetical protein